VVGRTVRLLAISRFTRTLSTLLAGGLPIVRALDTAKHVANNVVLGAAIDAARDSVTEGQSLAQPLRASGEFPPIVVHMVEVGERSGELEAMPRRSRRPRRPGRDLGHTADRAARAAADPADGRDRHVHHRRDARAAAPDHEFDR
jgi:hypothetical protein